MQLTAVRFGAHQIVVGILAVIKIKGVTKFMGSGTGGRKFCGISCRAEVRIITDVYVVLVAIVAVPLRYYSFKPEIKAIGNISL